MRDKMPAAYMFGSLLGKCLHSINYNLTTESGCILTYYHDYCSSLPHEDLSSRILNFSPIYSHICGIVTFENKWSIGFCIAIPCAYELLPWIYRKIFTKPWKRWISILYRNIFGNYLKKYEDEKQLRLEAEERYAEEKRLRLEATEQCRIETGRRHEAEERLSSEIAAKVATDPNLENVSEKNRPLNQRDGYEQIRSNQWLEAIEDLQDAQEDFDGDEDAMAEVNHKFLCRIFTVAYEICKGMRNKLIKIMVQPLGTKKEQKNSTEWRDDKHDKDILSLVSRWLSVAHESNTTEMAQETLNRIKEEDQSTQEFFSQNNLDPSSLPSVVNLAEDVCRLTWAMVLTVPPLAFKMEGVGEPFNENTQKVYYSCDPGDPVAYYIFPAMYHDEKLLCQGQVFTRKPH